MALSDRKLCALLVVRRLGSGAYGASIPKEYEEQVRGLLASGHLRHVAKVPLDHRGRGNPVSAKKILGLTLLGEQAVQEAEARVLRRVYREGDFDVG